MRYLLLAATAFSFISCISFPRAEREAMLRMEEEQQKSSSEAASGPYGPPVGKRKDFQDRYFRG